MARKVKDVTIDTPGRDLGKTFRITEMNPRKGEKWAGRVLFAAAKSKGVDDAEANGMALAGMAGLATLGVRSLTSIPWEDAEPLLDEMLTCVSFVPDPGRVDQTTMLPYARPLIEDGEDIEEVGTLLSLRSEVIELHTGFSPAVFLSKLGAAAKAKLNGTNTETSAPQSEP